MQFKDILSRRAPRFPIRFEISAADVYLLFERVSRCLHLKPFAKTPISRRRDYQLDVFKQAEVQSSRKHFLVHTKSPKIYI